jgi:heme exporter protein B
MNGLRVAWAVLRKDLLLDLRTRDRLGHMGVFVFLVLYLLSATLPESPVAARAWVPALLWILRLLTSLLGLARSLGVEAESGGLALLAQVPCDRGWIFVGKAAGNWIALLGVELWTALLSAVFLDVDWSPAGWRALAVGALGAAGLASLGSLMAALSLAVRFREFLLPVALFPLTLPVLLWGSRLTADALAGEPGPATWWGALGLYAWVFALIGYFVFDHVLED